MMRHQTGLAKTGLAAVIATLVVAVAAFAFYLMQENRPAYFIDPSDQGMVVRGQVIYQSHCASCHGAKLEGQANWRIRPEDGRLPAPPHDESGHTWHHSDTQLFDIVKHGLVPGRTAPPGYESDMPAYDRILSDEEIVAVLAYVKSQWPQKIREAQKDVSLQGQR